VDGSELIHLSEYMHRWCHISRHHPCHLPQKVNRECIGRAKVNPISSFKSNCQINIETARKYIKFISVHRKSSGLCRLRNVWSVRLQWSRGSVLPLSTQFRRFKIDRSRQDFSGRKNLQHAFLRRGSKAVGPMSQICCM
jgi:hypothetical protein